MNFRIETLGCKVNQYESQAMEQLLLARGYSLCPAGIPANVVILNTCAVTAESGRKSRQAVRRLSKENPGAFVAVCGCYSQTCGNELDGLGIDLIGGSGSRLAFLDTLEEGLSTRTPIVSRDDPRTRHRFEVLPAGNADGRTRAMLKIQDGCSNFCTYCIIPYARGPVRSMTLSDIRTEALRLKAEGFREIVITGIEISSYGKDLADETTLADALEAMAESAPGVRLHLGSLEPRTVTEDFCRRLLKLPDFCPHFHLSLQSGCDSTLLRMHRRYNTERFFESVQLLRSHFPNCGITTDLITGFPGETEEEFNDTLSFIRRCEFSAMHIFPYSVRPGTPAAEMPGQVEKAEKQRRSVLASSASDEMSTQFLQQQVGQILSVLFETEENGYSLGHSENYLEVRVPGEKLRGLVLPVQITGVNHKILCGEIQQLTV